MCCMYILYGVVRSSRLILTVLLAENISFIKAGEEVNHGKFDNSMASVKHQQKIVQPEKTNAVKLQRAPLLRPTRSASVE